MQKKLTDLSQVAHALEQILSPEILTKLSKEHKIIQRNGLQ